MERQHIQWLVSEARAMAPQLVAWRRDLHRHPELGFAEARTAGIVGAHLRSLGFQVRTGVAQTGIVGVLDGAKPGRTVLIRFDMDALPVQELGESDYRSTVPGVMHACGHDAHTAIGMGVAQVLAGRREVLPGTVMLVFQPAEEGSRGAIAMFEEDVFGGRTPDAALGLHVWSEVPAGDARVGNGPVMAAADTLNIEAEGAGTHGAMPHLGTDAVVIAAHIVTALQTVVSRSVDPRQPAVVTIGAIRGGTTRNVIAPSATMEGIIRTFDPATRDRVHARVRAVAEGTAAALGGRATVVIRESAPAVVNDERVADVVRDVAGGVLGPGRVTSDQFTMGSEDMSEFLSRVPGCYFFLGAAKPGAGPSAPHHSPFFDIDESILPSGVAILAGAAWRLLS